MHIAVQTSVVASATAADMQLPTPESTTTGANNLPFMGTTTDRDEEVPQHSGLAPASIQGSSSNSAATKDSEELSTFAAQRDATENHLSRNQDKPDTSSRIPSLQLTTNEVKATGQAPTDQHPSPAHEFYSALLKRLFAQQESERPLKKITLPALKLLRQARLRHYTIVVNFGKICAHIKRKQRLVSKAICTELGAWGTIEEKEQLLINGVFDRQQLEDTLRAYILDYVFCQNCRSTDTEQSRGLVVCNECRYRRAVKQYHWSTVHSENGWC